MRRDLLSVLDAMFDGLVVLDCQAGVEHLNGEACRILATSEDQALGGPVEGLLGDRHAVARLSRQVLSTGRRVVEDEVTLACRGVPDAVVDVAVSPLYDERRRVNGAVLVLRDRTISKSLRQRVSQREALDSYGLMAAGMAHELKNPLGGIRGAAELLGLAATNERSRETAELIVQEVDRITGLVDELMVFARRDSLRPDDLNLHRLLDGVLDLLALDSQCEGVSIERIYDPSIPDFWMDGERLTQVFLNLARNALQAMEETGGTLRVTTRMTLERRPMGANGEHLPMVEVAISDTGTGIPEEMLDQLATPFFTTRPSGTGLGLAISHHWVSLHGGTIELTSRLEQGTTARVALPLRRKA